MKLQLSHLNIYITLASNLLVHTYIVFLILCSVCKFKFIYYQIILIKITFYCMRYHLTFQSLHLGKLKLFVLFTNSIRRIYVYLKLSLLATLISSTVYLLMVVLLYFDETQNVNVNMLISARRLTRTAQND